MPASMVKTNRDEKLWTQAKDRAAAEGHEGDWPYVVGIFQRMKRGTAKGAHLPGMLLLPEGYGRRLWGLLKGAGHKYIKRVPIPGKYTKNGKPRYRYYYSVAHGGGIDAADHFVEGASFRHGDGHYHITKRDGPNITIRHDETGHEETIGPRELADKLRTEHSDARKAAGDKIKQEWKDAHESGASQKQLQKLKERAKAAGVQLPFHDYRSKESQKAADAFKGVPVPSIKTKSITIAMTDGKRPKTTAHVSGVWAFDPKSEKVTHVPSGVHVPGISHDAGAALFALLAHKHPELGKDIALGHASEIPKSDLDHVRAALDTANALHHDQKRQWSTDTLHAINDAAVAKDQARKDSALSKVSTDGPSRAFKLSPKIVSKDAAFDAAKSIATKDETRPSIQAVHFDGEGHAVATDGHRLVIIPTDHKAKETISTTGKAYDDRFPQWQMINPSLSDYKTATFDTEGLKAAMSAAKLHASKKTKIAHIYPDGIKAYDGGTEHGVPMPGHEGEIMRHGINTQYMLDALKGTKGPVRVHTKDQYSPIVVEREDGIKHIIMPMRI